MKRNIRLLGYPIRNISGITIAQYMKEDTREYYFVATINGFRTWYLPTKDINEAYTMTREIQQKIDSGDTAIFYDKTYSLKAFKKIL
jgi:hypothetical protein